MENRFNRIDGTAPIIDAAESKNISVPKSAFPFGRSVAGPMDIGALYPIDCFDTVPSERIDIDFTGLVDVLQPTVQKLINGFDVYIHAYYNRESDLWEGSKNFTTKGRSGQISASIPRIDPVVNSPRQPGDTPSTVYKYNLDTVGSLFDWLGAHTPVGSITSPYKPYYWDGSQTSSHPVRESYLPFTDLDGDPTSVIGSHSTFINAIPFFMYTRLWRDKYAPKNLLQSNKNIFPDNEDHFIIPYSAARFNKVDYTPDPGTSDFVYPYNTLYDPDNLAFNTMMFSSSFAYQYLYCDRIRFRQYKGDDFTTASPFPDLVRGDLPDLGDFIIYDKNITVSTANSSGSLDGSNSNPVFYAGNLQSSGSSLQNFTVSPKSGKYLSPQVSSLVIPDVLSKITTQSLVALNAYNIFAERMGRTNGDYDAMIKAQFGFDPQNQSREARYLGGLHFSLGNNEIQQTSESSSNSPLGETVVRSQGSGSGRIASFTSPDYGYVMIILSIVPNTWYADGQEAYLNQRYQTDRFFPIFEKLGPEAIKNKELFVSGNATTDDNVFGWAERGYRYKSRRNVVRSLFKARPNQILDMSSRVTARRFNTTPALNTKFTTITPDNFDYTIFANNEDYPFYFAGNIDVRRIAPMSEYTAPAGFNPATM